MGLGKTIQLIAMFLDAKNTSKNRETSIVVCPSSLYLNWENEINKFAPDLDVVVITGQARERKEKIQKINNYDVAITSYDMLKGILRNILSIILDMLLQMRHNI